MKFLRLAIERLIAKTSWNKYAGTSVQRMSPKDDFG